MKKARFYQAEFYQFARFGNAEFRGRHAGFRQTIFHRKAHFSGSVFSPSEKRRTGGTTFHRAKFNGEALFTRIEFNRIANFQNTSFNSLVIEENDIEEKEWKSTSLLDFSNSAVQDGELTILSANLFYNFEYATVGSLRIEDQKDAGNPFSQVQFYKTTFEGFDFRDHRAGLAPKWELVNQSSIFKTEKLDVSGLERTYLKAKNGALKVDDQVAASEFFVKEMRYRRKRYARNQNELDVFSENWRHSSYNLISNYLYDLIAVYGERPMRVVKWSIFTIGLFAILYPLTSGVQISSEETIQYAVSGNIQSFWKSIYFSIVTFTTVGYGDYQPVGFFAQLLASIESFVGSLLMALLVFVLGKQISR